MKPRQPAWEARCQFQRKRKMRKEHAPSAPALSGSFSFLYTKERNTISWQNDFLPLNR